MYVPGVKNTVTNTLSRLDTGADELNEKKKLFSKELYLNRRLFEDKVDYSIDFGVISREQDNNKWLDRILDDSQKKAMFKKKIFVQLDLWTGTVPGKDNNQRLSQVSENLVISILD